MLLRAACEAYHIDPRIIDIWEREEGPELLPVQDAAIQQGRLLDGNSLLIVSPTSSGKTFVAEMAAIRAVYQNRKAVFLLPIKALVEEKYQSFHRKYSALGLQVAISTRERQEHDDNILIGNFDIAVIVYEKFERLLIENPSLLRLCGLIVIDEIQMLAEAQRGADLELLLTHIRQSALRRLRPDTAPVSGANSPELQLIGLSAVLGDLNGLDQWLDVQTIVTTERAVELQEGVYHPGGHVRYRQYNAGDEGEIDHLPKTNLPAEFNPNEKENYRTRAAINLAKFFVEKDKQVLVYRKWRRLSRETALALTDALPNRPTSQLIKKLGVMEETLSKEALLDCLRHGVAFHNADLTAYERRQIEAEFCRPDTPLRVIVATSTLGMGVNLPVDVMIVADAETIDPLSQRFQEIPMSVAEYKNLSGRAGRLKLHTHGQSILISLSDFEFEKYWRIYVLGRPEAMRSALLHEHLLDMSLKALARHPAQSTEQIRSYLAGTFAGFSQWSVSEAEQAHFRQELQFAFKRGLREHLIDELPEKERFGLTRQGRICVLDGVSAATYLGFFKWLTTAKAHESAVSDWLLIFICAHAKEVETMPVRLSTLAFQEGRYVEDLANRLRKDLADMQPLLLQSFELTGDRYETVKKIKITLEMLDWIDGRPYVEIEKHFNKDYEDKAQGAIIRETGETLCWLMSTLAHVAAEHKFAEAFANRLRTLAMRLVFGLPEDGLDLAFLHVPELNRNHIMQLIQADMTAPDELLDVTPEEMEGILPRSALLAVQQAIMTHEKESAATLLKGQLIRLRSLGLETRLIENVYATGGKEFERAIEALLTAPPLLLTLQRIVDQKFGEPDYLLHVDDETIPIEIASTSHDEKKVSLKKAGEILHGAARYKPKSLIVIGKPDFHELAIRSAEQIATAYQIHYKLIPAYAVVEMFIRYAEGRLSRARLIEILQKGQGYLRVDSLK